MFQCYLYELKETVYPHPIHYRVRHDLITQPFFCCYFFFCGLSSCLSNRDFSVSVTFSFISVEYRYDFVIEMKKLDFVRINVNVNVNLSHAHLLYLA